MKHAHYLAAKWLNKPTNVHAYTTLKTGGVSKGDYSEYNLAAHVGDTTEAVAANRSQLITDLQLPSAPVWLDQVHSNKVIRVDNEVCMNLSPVQADASVSSTAGVVCVVLTADCLPVFFCDNKGTEIAVAHAGWRGLHAGIISNTIESMMAAAGDIQVSLGPAIGPQAFEVGEEVYTAFTDKNSLNAKAFAATRAGHYLCDMYHLARIELQLTGVGNVSGGEHCTFSESDRFYSYRQQATTGRMASLIWLQQPLYSR